MTLKNTKWTPVMRYDETMERIAVQYARATDQLRDVQNALETSITPWIIATLTTHRTVLIYRMQGMVIAFKCVAITHGQYELRSASLAMVEATHGQSLNEWLDSQKCVAAETMEETTIELANMLVNYSLLRSSEHPAGVRREYPDMN